MHIGFHIFQTAGHAMPFDAGVFGHLLCYDTLHHMDDFTRPFPEFFGSYVSAGGESSLNQADDTVHRQQLKHS